MIVNFEFTILSPNIVLGKSTKYTISHVSSIAVGINNKLRCQVDYKNNLILVISLFSGHVDRQKKLIGHKLSRLGILFKSW